MNSPNIEEWVNRYRVSNLYLIRCGDYYKIGTSLNVPKRMGYMQTGNPMKLEKHDASWCYYAIWWEVGLHKLFDAFRVRGEWFALRPQDVEFVQKIMEYHGDPYDIRCLANA